MNKVKKLCMKILDVVNYFGVYKIIVFCVFNNVSGVLKLFVNKIKKVVWELNYILNCVV